jgi:malate dehydrogenase (oxaloacetate-decarboxylating)
VGKRLEDAKVVVVGCGAAGTAIATLLLAAGARNVVGCDRDGALVRGTAGLSPAHAALAELTNPNLEHGAADDVLAGADAVIGVSRPGAFTAAGVARMANDAIVFAMANPMPEVLPSDVEGAAAIVATGRSDYPNQINNVLAFPGMFRGALDVRASEVTTGMELAAAQAIASVIPRDELAPDYVVPSVFNRAVAPAVAKAVAEAAEHAGVARKRPATEPVVS